jgi:hypothetical protein
VKFSCEIVLPPNSPNSPFGPENRLGDGLVKKFGPGTCVFRGTKLRPETILPPIAPYSPFGPDSL